MVKVLMPRLVQQLAVVSRRSLDSMHFMVRKSEILRKRHLLQPEFGNRLIPLYMNV